jgi:hypothetical protein
LTANRVSVCDFAVTWFLANFSVLAVGFGENPMTSEAESGCCGLRLTRSTAVIGHQDLAGGFMLTVSSTGAPAMG